MILDLKNLNIKNQKIIDQNDKQTDKIDKLLDFNVVIKEELQITNVDLKEQKALVSENNTHIKVISKQLIIAKDERAPKTKDCSKHNKFMLLKLNDPTQQWEFMAIRIQKKSEKDRLEDIKLKYPKLTIVIDSKKYQPNAINLFNLIKQELKSDKKISTWYNNIKLEENYTREQFLSDIQKVDDFKKEISI